MRSPGQTVETDCITLDKASFDTCRSISLDVAVLENLRDAAVVQSDVDWADVGSWSRVWELSPKDSGGNRVVGSAVGPSSEGCYIHSEGPLVVALGVRDLVIVATKDAVLVTTRDGDQAVRLVPDLPAVRDHDNSLAGRSGI